MEQKPSEQYVTPREGMGDFVVTDEWNRENIIQRLRLADINEQLPFHELRNEAADEIERLRAQLAAAEAALENSRVCARHYYEECLTQGEQESDKEWLARNPWLAESEDEDE